MYKVLVVDDEQWIRKWLVKIIPTFSDNVEVVNSFDNGENVIEEIQTHDIDIVISDIRMPIVGGLELIKIANEKNLKTKFILISGYDEFEYARSALKLGVVDYLLKPIEKLELKKALQKTIGLIESEKNSKGSSDLVQSAIYKILSRYIYDGDETELKNIKNICTKNGISYDYIKIGIIQSNYINSDEQIVKEVLINKMKDKLIKDLKLLIFVDSLNYFYIIFHQGSVDNLEILFDNLNRELENQNGKNIAKTIYSPWFRDTESIPYYYKEMKIKLENLNQLNINTSKSKLEEIKNHLNKYISTHDEISIKNYIEFIKEESLEEIINVDDVRIMLFNYISNIINELNDINDESTKKYINEGYDFCIKVYNYSNLNAMFDWIEDYSIRVINFLTQHEIFDVSQIVKQVYKQMQNDYGKDLSLSVIGDKYKINSSYFSKKFKEQIGENFVDCLTKIRVEASKELLLKTDKPIKDIGIEVGFKDSKYFSKVFALNMGVSPSVFRGENRNNI
ncbi:MAG: response regulator transcription factor [Pleomorphochaeta sp.]